MHRLWDHLESNLSSYVQPQELQSVGVSKTEPGSHRNESEDDKGNSIETYRRLQNQEYKGLAKVGDDEVPHPRKSVDNKVNSRNENQPRDSQTKPYRSPQSTTHRKRTRRDESQQPRKVIFIHLVLFKYSFSNTT